VHISPYRRIAIVLLNVMKFGIRGQLTNVITCQIFSQSVQGLRSSDTAKIAISHWLAVSPLQQCMHCRATPWKVMAWN